MMKSMVFFCVLHNTLPSIANNPPPLASAFCLFLLHRWLWHLIFNFCPKYRSVNTARRRTHQPLLSTIVGSRFFPSPFRPSIGLFMWKDIIHLNSLRIGNHWLHNILIILVHTLARPSSSRWKSFRVSAQITLGSSFVLFILANHW